MLLKNQTKLSLIRAQLSLFAMIGCAVVTQAQTMLSTPAAGFSSSSVSGPAEAAIMPVRAALSHDVSTKPFSTITIRPKIGTEGVGLDVVTPLNAHLDLRGGFATFSASGNPTIADVDLLAHVHLSSASLSVDYYPFKGSFRISPGLTLMSRNHVDGDGVIFGGTDITFGNADYSSDGADPLHATASLDLGQRIGPRLTIGWGNMIPHKEGKHFSVPFEIGAQYVGAPTVQLSFTGSACDNQGNCGPVATDAGFQQDIALEKAQLQSDLHALSFVPIISLGLSYKF